MCDRKIDLPRESILGWLKDMPAAIQEQASVFPLAQRIHWADEPHYTMGYFLDQDGLNVMITPVPLENMTCTSFRHAVDHSFPVGWKQLMREQRWH